MKHPHRSLWLLIGAASLVSYFGIKISAHGFEREPAQAFAKLEPGMTAEQVRQQVGPPKRIARQVLYHRYLEQWIYDQPSASRLHFDCHRGEKPQLVWKQMLTDEKNDR
jgi:hypothetical protein